MSKSILWGTEFPKKDTTYYFPGGITVKSCNGSPLSLDTRTFSKGTVVKIVGREAEMKGFPIQSGKSKKNYHFTVLIPSPLK